MSTTDWTAPYRELIADCRKRDHMISAWEADFLDSVEARLDERRALTEKQSDTLDVIWNKATSRG